jgi:hypothetical protein
MNNICHSGQDHFDLHKAKKRIKIFFCYNVKKCFDSIKITKRLTVVDATKLFQQQSIVAFEVPFRVKHWDGLGEIPSL